MRHSAVDHDLLPGDERGGIGREVRSHPGDPLRRSRAIGRYASEDVRGDRVSTEIGNRLLDGGLDAPDHDHTKPIPLFAPGMAATSLFMFRM